MGDAPAGAFKPRRHRLADLRDARPAVADAVQHGGGAKLIATHPDPVERLANVQAWIGTAWDADYADRIVSTREFEGSKAAFR